MVERAASARLRFQGKIALVTGASRGIGRATANELALEGASVVVTARGSRDLDETAGELNRAGAASLAVAGDVREPAVVEDLVGRALERFGRIDVLVTAAGGGSAVKGIDAIEDAEWARDLDLNLTSVFRVCREVVPLMKDQGYGRIVNVSSVAGRSRGHLSGTAYSAAKAGLLGLTRHMAWDLGRHGVTVNAVAPGLTETARALEKWELRPPEERKHLLERVALRRFAKPREVARAILFLASDDASYITGATLDVNGGILMT